MSGGKLLERLLDVLESIFLNWDREEFQPETKFVDDLGADSLDMVELAAAVEDEFGFEISDEEARKLVTVGDLIELVIKKIK